jgi:hypothetical protein
MHITTHFTPLCGDTFVDVESNKDVQSVFMTQQRRHMLNIKNPSREEIAFTKNFAFPSYCSNGFVSKITTSDVT